MRLIRWEVRHLRHEFPLAWLAAALCAACAFALWNGWHHLQWQKDLIDEARSHSQRAHASAETMLQDLQAGRLSVSDWLDPRIPSSYASEHLLLHAIKPPRLLGSFSIGQSDLYSPLLRVSPKSLDETLSGVQNVSPERLLSGTFDLSFFVIYVMPLIVLALVYNLLSAERERGTLSLLAMSRVTLARIARARALVRVGALIGTLAITLTVAFAVIDGFSSGEGMQFLLWIAVMSAYQLFWAALAVAIAHRATTSATNAVILTGAWLLFTIVLPSLVSLVVKTAYPAPARTELVLAQRDAGDAAVQQRSKLMQSYFEDHPQLGRQAESPTEDTPGVAVPQWAIDSFLTHAEEEREIGPVRDRYRAQLARQQRMTDLLKFLSPAMLAQSAFNDLGGTGLGRHQHFLQQAESLHRALQSYIGPLVVGRRLLTGFDDVPVYSWREPTLRWEAPLACLAMLLACVALLAISARRQVVAS